MERVEIKIQDVRNECKREASNDIHEKPRKIIRKEMSSIENDTIIGSNDVSLIRNSCYEHRKLLLTLLNNL